MTAVPISLAPRNTDINCDPRSTRIQVGPGGTPRSSQEKSPKRNGALTANNDLTGRSSVPLAIAWSSCALVRNRRSPAWLVTAGATETPAAIARASGLRLVAAKISAPAIATIPAEAMTPPLTGLFKRGRGSRNGPTTQRAAQERETKNHHRPGRRLRNWSGRRDGRDLLGCDRRRSETATAAARRR